MKLLTSPKKTDNLNFGEEENVLDKGVLIDREQIKNTPFEIISTEQGSFMCMGKYRFTEAMKTKAEVKKYFEAHTYDIILQMIMSVHQELTKKNEK